MRKILLCLACLTILVLAQPAVAQSTSSTVTAKIDLQQVPQVEISVFLASLSTGVPTDGVQSRNHCGENFCALEKAACAADCAPCGSVATCYHYVCDSSCGCIC
jgi:hypothetical protein